VFLHHKGDFKLGSDAVRGTDKDGAFEIGQVERKKAAKPADFTHNSGSARLLGYFFDIVDQAVGLVNINTRVGICKRF